MENDGQRPFKEISAIPISVQRGPERFPRRTRATNPPPKLESWRCNLTALSHIHNLYFVASRSSILVYEPNFPDQKLPANPSLILYPTGSHPDPEVFHPLGGGRLINHLLVDFLGNDEIVLIALHDGRVIGYHIDQIQHAIDRREDPDCVETTAGDDVRPFFSEGLGKSAWGLAVHREARLIAVSCNAHTVTVFAFALTHDLLPNPSSWLDRSESQRITTPDSGENIPCVSFCNTGDDPEGRYLVTSDINGLTRVFDLARTVKDKDRNVDVHANRFCATIDRAGQKQCGCHHLDGGIRYYLHATWGVMWLDRRAFKRTENVEEALGCTPSFEKSANSGDAYDCSSSRVQVRDSRTVYDTTLHQISQGTNHAGMTMDPGTLADVEQAEPLNELFAGQGYRLKRQPVNPNGASNPFHKVPAAPIMRMSVKDIFLLQPRSTKRPSLPAIGLFDPFFQQINDEPALDEVSVHDRINLFAQIVELGLAIVGSAKGRVAILSLTQTGDELQRSRKPLYGCRIDHILPFYSQEKAGQRPLAPLVGVAVGPIQGMLGRQADYSRRWRLLMMYADNSVLSYELGKFGEERVRVREFGGLVV